MEFKDWLQTNKSRRGPVPGAFGRDPRRMRQQQQQHRTNAADRTPPPSSPASHGRMDNRFQSYSDRVNYGKSIEDQIYTGLEGCGLKLRKPTSREDMYAKIDGWWSDGEQEHPVQIKYRDTGDDILFEVMKDYRNNVPGRDMVGRATHYAVLSRDGRLIRVVLVAEAKSIINQMVQQVETQGWPDSRMNFKMRVQGGFAVLRVRPDPQTGVEKLMAYIPPSALTSVQECPASIAFR